MKLIFAAFESKSPGWVSQGREEYIQKISHFFPLEWRSLKTPSLDRDEALTKQKKEAETLLKFLEPSDFLILFDEAGTNFSDSKQFSEHLKRVVESGKSRAIFVIGGPYGFHEEIKKRAQARWSLSKLTLNHWIAQLTALEQIYRGFTILKGLPYHNS